MQDEAADPAPEPERRDAQAAAGYVRFRSAHVSARGYKVGVFGLVNVLGRHGMLTPDEERFRRENNAWYDAAYPSPPRTH